MSDEPGNLQFLELAADLTVAWLSNPGTKVTAQELPAVIATIHSALTGLSAQGHAAESKIEYPPAVTVRQSLASREHIISLIDGKPYKLLKRHLALNGLTPAEYRARYGLKPDYPVVSPAYAEKRRMLAKQIGLGRKVGEKPRKAAAKPADMPEQASAAAPKTKAAGRPRKMA